MNIINKIKNLITEIRIRWTSESPKFWKVIQSFSITVGSIAASIVAGDKIFDLQTLGVAPIIFTVCGYILTFCCALGLAAKITKQ